MFILFYIIFVAFQLVQWRRFGTLWKSAIHYGIFCCVPGVSFYPWFTFFRNTEGKRALLREMRPRFIAKLSFKGPSDTSQDTQSLKVLTRLLFLTSQPVSLKNLLLDQLLKKRWTHFLLPTSSWFAMEQ